MKKLWIIGLLAVFQMQGMEMYMQELSFLKKDNKPLQVLVVNELISNPTIVKFLTMINSPETTQANADYFKTVVAKLYEAIEMYQTTQAVTAKVKQMLSSKPELNSQAKGAEQKSSLEERIKAYLEDLAEF